MTTQFGIFPLEVFQDRRLNLVEIRILLCLLSFRAKNTDTIWPSRAAIGARSGYQPQVISRAVTGLVEKGWLERKQHRGPNTYRVTVPEHDTVPDHDTVSDHDTVPEHYTETVTSYGTPEQTRNRPKKVERASAPRATDGSSRKNGNGTRNAFCPPTLDEIRAYARETGTLGCANAFHDHFESNGWRVGRGGLPMKDWRAAYRAWHRRQEEFNGGG